jgi:hypothetical protein
MRGLGSGRQMAARRSTPWWRIATLALLLVALVIAVSSGRTIEAVVIGVLMIPALTLLGAWIYGLRRRRV